MNITEQIPFDLVIAYRKAKADLYYSSNPRLFDLWEYEKNLETNLSQLNLAILHNDEAWFKTGEFLGTYTVMPSKVEESPAASALPSTDSLQKITHFGSSIDDPDNQNKVAEFRLMEKCSIHFHVLSAYWIAKIGARFDEKLGSEVYANRVRRTINNKYNSLSIGSFNPYFYGYKRWQDSAYESIQDLLDGDLEAIAVSTDISGYFHNLSANFLLTKEFKKAIGFKEYKFDESEIFLHKVFTNALIDWETSVAAALGIPSAGLPVGLAASGLVANIALIELDAQIKDEIKPRFYGRYVDDIMIVLESGAHFSSESDVWSWISKRVDSISTNSKSDTIATLKPSYLHNINLEFAASKTKSTKLDGFRGRQTLASLKDTIRSRSSEWNLLPDVPSSPEHVSNLIVKALDSDGAPGDSLNKVTQLTTTRSGFAIALRNFEAVARDVSPSTWTKYREKFYDSIHEQVLNPSKYFELSKYIPRILSLAISCNDWKEAEKLTRGLVKIHQVIASKYEIKLKALDTRPTVEIRRLSIVPRWLETATDSLLATVAASPGSDQEKKAIFKSIRQISGPKRMPSETPGFDQLFTFDLARIPYKSLLAPKYLNQHSFKTGKLADSIVSEQDFAIDPLSRGLKTLIRGFDLAYQGSPDAPVAPKWNSNGMIFATRPLGVSEILLWTRLLSRPELQHNLASWLAVTRGYKGNNWMSERKKKKKLAPPIKLKKDDVPDKSGKVRIAVGSLQTNQISMILAAKNKPHLDLARYKQITALINSVLTTTEHSPHYLLLPEVSIPSEWFIRLASKLLHKNISLIAGVEFLVTDQNEVRNQIWHGLVHSELGFDSLAVYRQDKQRPAPGEETFLWELDQLRLVPEIKGWKRPPIIQHGDFKFASLICSELTNAKYRALLRGKIDALMVAESNKDLKTFNSLVEATALDVHCFVAQANNREYGDSRIRSPHRTDYKRDIIRVRGGLNDHFATGEIEVHDLRRFQSAYRNPNGNFKPVPDGFHDDMDPARRKDR